MGSLTTEERRVDEIIWRKDLYPRFEPNPAVIQQYAESIELLPPIEINQRNELIDGYHRWVAHKKANAETISVFITPTASDAEFLRVAIERNAKHGLQLSNEEKRSLVLKMYTGKDEEKTDFARLMSVSERTIARWTERRDRDLKKERDRRIADLWLACWTEEEIAAEVGCDSETVGNVVEKSLKNDNWQKLGIFAEYRDPGWLPPLYNVWKRQEKTNAVNHFGNSEASFLDNLLYLYTEPFDIVVDPFAGGGSTIDVCKKRLRRYWVSDRLPIVERTDVRQWEILDGPPPLRKRWGDVALLYLDPPYWKQAAGKYSQDAADLANMALDDYYAKLSCFVRECAAKMKDGSHVALMISPTQWPTEDKRVIDHVVDLVRLLTSERLVLMMRISCPYESQQYNGNQVMWARDNRRILILTREIIIWRITAQ